MDQIRPLTNEITTYKGQLTAKCIVKNTAIIKKSFPALPIDFFDILTDRLKANGFTDERLNDAVSHVVDTCVYPTPTIAQFISWDKKIKVFTYQEMLKKWDDGVTDAYQPVQFPDRIVPVWVHVNDIKMYNLKSTK